MFTAIRPQGSLTKPPLGLRADLHHPLVPFSCWLLNEGAGVQLNDAVLGRQSSAGIQTTALPTWVAAGPGGRGPALRFVSASSQYIDLANAFTVAGQPLQLPWGQGTPRFVGSKNVPSTIAARFRTTNAGTTGLTLYSEFGQFLNGALTLQVNAASAGRLTGAIRNDANVSVALPVNGTINDGAWHTAHLVNGGDGHNAVLYKDGVAIFTAANNLGSALQIDASRLGSFSGTNGQQFFDGDIDYVMTWARALSPAEVRDTHANPFSFLLPLLPRQTSLLPPTAVIDRRSRNFRPASRIARGGL